MKDFCPFYIIFLWYKNDIFAIGGFQPDQRDFRNNYAGNGGADFYRGGGRGGYGE